MTPTAKNAAPLRLRDDAKELFDSLESLLKKKNDKLQVTLSNGRKILHAVISGNQSSIDNIITEDDSHICEINSLDFDIRSTIDKICVIFGIEYRKFSDLLSDLGQQTACPELYAKISVLLKENSEMRAHVVCALEKEAAEAKKNADELSARLKINRMVSW